MDREVLLHMKEQMKPDQNVVDELMKKLEEMQNEDIRKRRWTYNSGKIIAAAAVIVILVVGGMMIPADGTMARNIRNFFLPKKVEENVEGYEEEVEMQPVVRGEEDEKTADYVIFVDKEIFETQKKNGVQIIKGIANPKAKMTISQEMDISVEECLEKIKKEKDIEAFEEAESLSIEAEYQGILVTTGLNWDDVMTRIYCIDNGQGGCFIIEYCNTVEADEGFGSRFRTMLNTFEIIDREEE